MSSSVEPHSHSRFTIVWPHILIALAAFSVLRIALLVRAWPEVSHTVWNGMYIFTLGLFYDLAFISYACIPFVLFLLFLPDKLYHSRVNRYATYLMSLAVFYGLYFSCTAEWLFWEEFGTRFNFISVDYLIYRHEVAQNIYESYPLIPILMALMAAAVLTFVLIRKPLAGALQAVEPFRRRVGRAVPFFIVPVTAVLLVGQSLRTLSPNNYVNELASNGPYQFVAAFRHNELDYNAFYRQGDDVTLSTLLRSRIDPADSQRFDGQVFDIRRRIESASCGSSRHERSCSIRRICSEAAISALSIKPAVCASRAAPRARTSVSTLPRNHSKNESSAMRFSMSGTSQYFAPSKSGCRCTIVTRAPARISSSAVSTAEFFPPITRQSSFQHGWGSSK